MCHIDEKTSVRRVVRWYSKSTEKVVGEVEITAPLSELQGVFGEPSDERMYDCFPIHEEEAPFIEMHIGVKLRLGQFDYFLESDAAS
jgi:hypothetical protein